MKTESKKVDNVKKFGERLFKLREERKENQLQLAQAIGITRQSLSRYETNERTPNIDLIYSIAKYFNVSADYLLGLSDSKRIAEQIESDDEFVSSAIEKIAWHYGKTHQSEILLEECAELIQAVQKCKRNNADISENLKEEIADVMIMCLQMREFVGKGSIDDIIVEKLQRQLERIEEESKK